ncbi:MAG TPA: MarR family winged helix-turn-helix transcriptional regulator [Gaiellaceae bacterium]|nr:MarR family winged helix-turn-helix transcriptional regulator [Gaiellaceae bacterium]
MAAAELRVRMLAFQRRSEEITARHRLTPQRYLLLLLLRASEAEGNELAIGSLIEPLQMSQSSVTRLVQGATRAGLVERHVDPDDRRRQHLALTGEGRRRFEGAFLELGPDRLALESALSKRQKSPLPAAR